MHRRFQFGMRENPASDRRHGSRLAESSTAKENSIKEGNLALAKPSLSHNHPLVGADGHLHAASPHAATGHERQDESHLLTVQEVAALLQVPSSWVYEHTRHRCLNRIPGIRLGKYWRFQKADVIRWLDTNRKKDYRHAG